MARKLDHMADRVLAFQNKRAELSKMEREARKFREEVDKEQTELIKIMGASVEATIDGQKVFEVADTERRSTSVAAVLKHAPELADALVTVNYGKKIKFV